MADNVFGQICALVGIEVADDPSVPALTEDDQRALLTAWDLLPAEGGSMAETLSRLQREHWQRLLPPALVVHEEEGSLALGLHLDAVRCGVPLHWHVIEESGAHREGVVEPMELEVMATATVDGTRYLALRLRIAPMLSPGYHRIIVTSGKDADATLRGECLLIVPPSRCYCPPGLQQESRIWGLSCDLAAMRSRRNWGYGDLSDLQALLGWAAENGAGTVAVGPLWSRPAPPENRMYVPLPSDPSFPDPLLLDVEAIADFHESEEVRALVANPAFQVRLSQLREADELHISDMAALKREVTEVLWRHFQHHHLNPETERGWTFRHFQDAGGERLRSFALHAVLQEYQQNPPAATSAENAWPSAGADRRSPEVIAFAERHGERIELQQYLQWQLELQLAAAGQRSMELGLKVGLMLTIPAGIDPHGFAAWHQPSLYGRALRVREAAAPCHFHGPPVLASRLAAVAYQPFVAMLRAHMRHAGALRFSSIELLYRQWWQWGNGSDGGRIAIVPPWNDLLAIVALESQRNRCLVIGEHLSPLAPEFAETLRRLGILTSYPGFFAVDPHSDWREPASYPEQAVVTASRADFCTLDGFWRGTDLTRFSTQCNEYDDAAHEEAIIARTSDRARLLVALKHARLLPPGQEMDPVTVFSLTPALIRAVYVFLSRTPARILLIHVMDLMALAGPEHVSPPPRHLPAQVPLSWERLVAAEEICDLFRECRRERAIGVVRPSVSLVDRRQLAGQALPQAFYRMQLNKECTFLQAAAHLPYLRELGISHCYVSPYLKARPGSSHGYDIIDHSQLNPEIGTREEYEEFVAALERNGMAQILDMVPNHMGVGSDNRWWMDVLENGQASMYATFFDINWQSQDEELKSRLLLPVLGNHFGIVLETGELRLVFQADRGSFSIVYYQHRYPIAPRSYPDILGHDLQRLEARLGGQHEGFLELQNLIASFTGLPGREESSPEQMEMRNRNKEVLKRLLARLCREVPEIGTFIEENVLRLNGEPGKPESFDALETLLSRQAYRLAYWRVASDEINYRRFFDINELAGLRMDRKEVFEHTHRLVLDLIATGKIDGLRIDHPDGLYDPEQYLRTLQAAVSGEPLSTAMPLTEAADTTGKRRSLPLYVVVEKILTHGEQLPEHWLVHGTTGYDFSRLLNGIFVDQAAEKEMTRLYHRFIGREIDCTLLARECKRLIIKSAMAGEINVLSDQLHRLAKRNRATRDYTLSNLREALSEIVACFPVYRTYCTEKCFDALDRCHVHQAVNRAKARWQAEDTSIYEFIRSVLLLEAAAQPEGGYRDFIDFIMKFQQYTGPVMAKGLEDTAYFIYNRLLSLNEVGDDPSRFGQTVAAFHAANRYRADKWPHAMLNTSTHDSKRSEDVRARINVLSEMVAEWGQAVDRWHTMNLKKKTMIGQELAPSNNDEYALYQQLLGVWSPETMTETDSSLFRDRFTHAMLKAACEAKVHTSWLNRNQAYEDALTVFIERLLNGEDPSFLDDFRVFAQRTSRFGILNSLSQLLLKLTSPGIPDTYQGNESWRLCLVDPDNRRPVDYDHCTAMLASLQQLLQEDTASFASRLRGLLDNAQDGRIKMYVLWRTLSLRREQPELFLHGAYLPLAAAGPAKAHLCAFIRSHGKHLVLTAVPRLAATLLRHDATRWPLGREVWQETALCLPQRFADYQFVDRLSGEAVKVGTERRGRLLAAHLFRSFPVALLVGTEQRT